MLENYMNNFTDCDTAKNKPKQRLCIFPVKFCTEPFDQVLPVSHCFCAIKATYIFVLED